MSDAVDHADERRNDEHGGHRGQHHLGAPLHDERGEHRRDADHVGDREVDRSGENRKRLAEGYDAERDHPLQEADHAVGLEHLGLAGPERDDDIKRDRSDKKHEWGGRAAPPGGGEAQGVGGAQ